MRYRILDRHREKSTETLAMRLAMGARPKNTSISLVVDFDHGKEVVSVIKPAYETTNFKVTYIPRQWHGTRMTHSNYVGWTIIHRHTSLRVFVARRNSETEDCRTMAMRIAWRLEKEFGDKWLFMEFERREKFTREMRRKAYQIIHECYNPKPRKFYV